MLRKELKMKKCIHITAGRGPEECCLVVAQVLKRLIKQCKETERYYQVVHREPGSINGNLRSASLLVDVKNEPGFLNDWMGTIQWTSESPFRAKHKRKNWFVRVFEIPMEELGEFDPNAVRFESFRSGGPGGQHVNKVASCVRATHLPSGLTVKVSDTRSQMQNRKIALQRLAQAWNAQRLEQVAAIRTARWSQHAQLERGNPVKTFYAAEIHPEHEIKKTRDRRTKEKQEWKREFDHAQNE
jgi:peptide chain release factor